MDSTPPFPSSVPPPMAAQKSNTGKWVVFGCAGCLGLAVLGVLVAVVIFKSKFNSEFERIQSGLNNRDVIVDAFKKAEQSAEVLIAIGSPMEAAFFPRGSVKVHNGVGHAGFTLPISGPEGGATIKVNASKSPGGAWQYSVLEVELPDGKTVDLRDSP